MSEVFFQLNVKSKLYDVNVILKNNWKVINNDHTNMFIDNNKTVFEANTLFFLI